MKLNEILSNGLEFLLRPTKTARKLKGKVSFSEGLIAYTVVAAIVIMIYFITQIITELISGTLANMLLFNIALSAILFVISVVGSVVVIGITWLVGKLLGGKAEFGDFYGVLAYSILGVYVISSVVTDVFSIISAVVVKSKSTAIILIVVLIQLLLILVTTVLYLIYETIATREVHNISTIKAAVAAFVQIVLGFIAGFIIGVVIAIVGIAGK